MDDELARLDAELDRRWAEASAPLLALIRRADDFSNAYAAVEDIPPERISEEARGLLLATLVAEERRALFEVRRYREELGLSSE